MLTAIERDVMIEALDQFISNAEEEGESPQLITARALLERMQVQKLNELGV